MNGYQTPASPCRFSMAMLIYVTLVANLSRLISMPGPLGLSLNLKLKPGNCEILEVGLLSPLELARVEPS